MIDIDVIKYGRISEINTLLRKRYGDNYIDVLTPQEKLNYLCEVLSLTKTQFDSLIAQNSPILRTVKGHSFETVFDKLIIKNGYDIIEVGGDEGIDRIVNNISLQLKTPTASGTRGNFVQYKTHKTHGAKSELESMDYYHSKSEFADYLVGLINYTSPFIIFLSKDELPTHPADNNRIISPFRIQWNTHSGLNAFEKIGIPNINLSVVTAEYNDDQELLPFTSCALQLKSELIIDTILREKNFRIWDMAIRGFAREVAFKSYLNYKTIIYKNPPECGRERADKSDIALIRKTSGHFKYLQVKGASLRICRFEGLNSRVGIETQLTRGRVNDHPTQSRLYLKNDFDYLIVCLDPCIARQYLNEIGREPKLEWQFFSIPTSDLVAHPRFHRRIKSHQYLSYLDLIKYRISNDWLGYWQTP